MKSEKELKDKERQANNLNNMVAESIDVFFCSNKEVQKKVINDITNRSNDLIDLLTSIVGEDK